MSEQPIGKIIFGPGSEQFDDFIARDPMRQPTFTFNSNDKLYTAAAKPEYQFVEYIPSDK